MSHSPHSDDDNYSSDGSYEGEDLPFDDSNLAPILSISKLKVHETDNALDDDADSLDELHRGEEIDLEIIVVNTGDVIKHRMFISAAIENLKQYLDEEHGFAFDKQRVYDTDPQRDDNAKDVPNPLSLSDIKTISVENKGGNVLWLKVL